MAKTKEELNALKQECESLKSKAQELTDDELGYVVGGVDYTLLAQLGILPYFTTVFGTLQGAIAGVKVTSNDGQPGEDVKIR